MRQNRADMESSMTPHAGGQLKVSMLAAGCQVQELLSWCCMPAAVMNKNMICVVK